MTLPAHSTSKSNRPFPSGIVAVTLEGIRINFSFGLPVATMYPFAVDAVRNAALSGIAQMTRHAIADEMSFTPSRVIVCSYVAPCAKMMFHLSDIGQPQVVLIAFGMENQNRRENGGNDVPSPRYAVRNCSHIRTIVSLAIGRGSTFTLA